MQRSDCRRKSSATDPVVMWLALSQRLEAARRGKLKGEEAAEVAMVPPRHQQVQ